MCPVVKREAWRLSRLERSRGGSVEPPKLYVKTYNKRAVKKKGEPTQLINIYPLKMIFLCVLVRENSNKNKTNLCLVENGL